MASVNLRWDSERIQERAKAVVLRRMQAAAVALEEQTKQRLGTPYPPPSRPGEPPHRRSGALQRGVKFNVRVSGKRIRLAGTVLAHYARFLQRGTRKMAKRPFLGLPVDRRLLTDILTGRRRS